MASASQKNKVLKRFFAAAFFAAATVLAATQIPDPSFAQKSAQQTAQETLASERTVLQGMACAIYKVIEKIVLVMAVASIIAAAYGFSLGKQQFAWVAGICVNLLLLSVLVQLISFLAFSGGTGNFLCEVATIQEQQQRCETPIGETPDPDCIPDTPGPDGRLPGGGGTPPPTEFPPTPGRAGTL